MWVRSGLNVLKIVCNVFSDCETLPKNIVVKYSVRYKQGTTAEGS